MNTHHAPLILRHPPYSGLLLNKHLSIHSFVCLKSIMSERRKKERKSWERQRIACANSLIKAKTINGQEFYPVPPREWQRPKYLGPSFTCK